MAVVVQVRQQGTRGAGKKHCRARTLLSHMHIQEKQILCKLEAGCRHIQVQQLDTVQEAVALILGEEIHKPGLGLRGNPVVALAQRAAINLPGMADWVACCRRKYLNLYGLVCIGVANMRRRVSYPPEYVLVRLQPCQAYSYLCRAIH